MVNAKYAELHTKLDELKAASSQSTDLEEDQKFDLTVDVETIRDQLAKSEPDRSVIERLWGRIEQVATLHDFSEAVSKLAPFVGALLSG